VVLLLVVPLPVLLDGLVLVPVLPVPLVLP
jgi:hypothetical protein